jgi:hypothetical protein
MLNINLAKKYYFLSDIGENGAGRVVYMLALSILRYVLMKCVGKIHAYATQKFPSFKKKIIKKVLRVQ